MSKRVCVGGAWCVSYVHSCMAEPTYWSGKSQVVLKATSA
jgi:hypothetical protein